MNILGYRNTINFQGRSNIKISTEALIIKNCLLKAFDIALEDTNLILDYHIHSTQITLNPDDKRWDEWSDTFYIVTDEIVRFSLRFEDS
ncbi:hypothetical protein GA840_09885 [Pediococcus ethanolidurans]|uniref:hypothetical protein n=1 Tax=Pediococcus ethanolidurans TaxID=319653 RepID=UPI0029552B90|nr:hypothetical protein [Pediococcus ethanolidurans]MDV7720147.1 hypothetical protein [Pediococcus ethanolidurans]